MIDSIHRFIENASKLKVAVIGETIIDEFVPVFYEGQSMKSFCPVFRQSNIPKQSQEGGALAIANHLKGFVDSVTVFSNPKDSIVKSRLYDVNDNKKYVEHNNFQTERFPEITIDCRDFDVVILADFGHGLSDKININEGFHLMCQTNSNNFGFNRLSKWKALSKKSVCVDLREASLQINRRINSCSDDDAKEIFKYELNTSELFITLGASGSLFTDGANVVRHGAYKTEIIDTIGAGDTFFSFSTISSTLKMDDKLLIPSLAASLSTTWLCNEQSVTPKKLLEHADRFI